MIRNQNCLAAALVAGILLAASPALAHPHVFVDAKAEIVFDKNGAITAIRHIWQFDPDFTAMEYFVAFTFIKDGAVTLDGAPKRCSAVYHPPYELDAQTMTILSAIPYDQHDLPPELEQAASVLANVIEMKCSG